MGTLYSGDSVGRDTLGSEFGQGIPSSACDKAPLNKEYSTARRLPSNNVLASKKTACIAVTHRDSGSLGRLFNKSLLIPHLPSSAFICLHLPFYAKSICCILYALYLWGDTNKVSVCWSPLSAVLPTSFPMIGKPFKTVASDWDWSRRLCVFVRSC